MELAFLGKVTVHFGKDSHGQFGEEFDHGLDQLVISVVSLGPFTAQSKHKSAWVLRFGHGPDQGHFANAQAMEIHLYMVTGEKLQGF